MKTKIKLLGFLSKGVSHHVHNLSTAIKFEEKAGPWIPEANEHKERPEGAGSAPTKRAVSPDSV